MEMSQKLSFGISTLLNQQEFDEIYDAEEENCNDELYFAEDANSFYSAASHSAQSLSAQTSQTEALTATHDSLSLPRRESMLTESSPSFLLNQHFLSTQLSRPKSETDYRSLLSAVLNRGRLSASPHGEKRIGHPYQSRLPARHKKPRTSFTKAQVAYLETRFVDHKYLASTERAKLAAQLDMSDSQVKTWFQNRRTKWR